VGGEVGSVVVCVCSGSVVVGAAVDGGVVVGSSAGHLFGLARSGTQVPTPPPPIVVCTTPVVPVEFVVGVTVVLDAPSFVVGGVLITSMIELFVGPGGSLLRAVWMTCARSCWRPFRRLSRAAISVESAPRLRASARATWAS
jgi:hypothetical protein